MRTSLVLLTAVVAALVAAAPAQAAPAVALTPDNDLLFFDTATPATVTRSVSVFGLGANETLRGIDVRLVDGLLYGSTVTTGSAANSVVRTYTIDTATGKATLTGATAAALAGAADVPTAFALNPLTSVDRFRYANTNDENARLVPATGALAGNDTDLTPAATSTVIAAAYDRSVAGTTATTLFAIDRNDSQLALIGGINSTPSPNGGVVTDIGALGFTLGGAADGGFDIAPEGTAFAGLTNAADNVTSLYTVNLASGGATAIGPVGSGTTEVRSLAILPDPPASTPAAPQLVTVTVPAPTAAAAPDREAPFALVALDRAPRLASLLRGTVRFRFSCSEACAATATLRSGTTLLASGRATLTRAGIGRLRFTRSTGARARAIRRLQRASRRRATLALTVVDASGNRRTVRQSVTLAR